MDTTMDTTVGLARACAEALCGVRLTILRSPRRALIRPGPSAWVATCTVLASVSDVSELMAGLFRKVRPPCGPARPRRSNSRPLLYFLLILKSPLRDS